MEPHWLPFAVFVVVVTGAIVALTHASADVFEGGANDLAPVELLAHATGSQVVLAAVLLAAIWLARIPADTFGLATSPRLVTLGVATGVAIAAANEAVMRGLDATGLGYDETLREALTPASLQGWLVLLVVALPVVAGFEELLFRGIIVGAFAAGFGVSPWLLAAASSVVFGAAHAAQGAVGVVVTTLLGFALAVAYVLTGSLLVVFVAHYVVNTVEFVLHAGD